MELHGQNKRHDRERMREAWESVDRPQMRLIAAVSAFGHIDDLNSQLRGELRGEGLVPLQSMSHRRRLPCDEDGGSLRVLDPVLRGRTIAVRVDGVKGAALMAPRGQDHRGCG